MAKDEKIVWVAGENSGDYLASLVLPQLMKSLPDFKMEGIGGTRMQAAGMNTWYPSSALSVRGYLEVLSHLPKILKIRSDVIKRVTTEKPSLYVGVDAPDFNLSIEEKARIACVPVVHMVAPAIWAWRPGRIHQIRRSVDHLLLVFPFEEEIFKKAGIPATYVGHPLASVIPMVPDVEGARKKLGIFQRHPVIAVLPGSRRDEIKWCGDRFFGACALVQKSEPNVVFVVPAADEPRKKEIQKILDGFPTVKDRTILLDGDSHTALEAADAVLVASGTATLETALFKKPMVVGYAMPAITAMMMLTKGDTKWISLPNILAQKTLVPECLQMFCSPEILSSHLLDALEPAKQEYLGRVFTDMHESLLRDTPTLATNAIQEVLEKHKK